MQAHRPARPLRQDLGATISAGNVLIGDVSGSTGRWPRPAPFTPAELAAYIRHGRAVRARVAPGPGRRRLRRLRRRRRPLLAGRGAGARLRRPGRAAAARRVPARAGLPGRPSRRSSTRSGPATGIAWGEHDPGVFVGCERFYRPGYVANLVSAWIPAVDGLADRADRRHRGRRRRLRARRLDHGSSPTPTRPPRCAGFDPHAVSIELARAAQSRRYAAPPRGRRTSRAPATGWSPRSTACTTWATRSAPPGTSASALADDGVWLIVEPYAGAAVADNLTPVGRLYYSFSTFLCVPHAISEGAADALGNQAGEKPIAELVEAAGFGRFRRVAETPFNLVYEARP